MSAVSEWVRFMRINHRKPGEHAPHAARFGARAKLSEEDVRSMRARFDATDEHHATIKVLAEEYQLSRGTVSDIVHRRTWKGVE